MTIFLNQYLTEYDDSLSADSYIDPIGTLIIWSAFGRQVIKIPAPRGGVLVTLRLARFAARLRFYSALRTLSKPLAPRGGEYTRQDSTTVSIRYRTMFEITR